MFALKNSLVLLAKHESGELHCPATALIKQNSDKKYSFIERSQCHKDDVYLFGINKCVHVCLLTK